MQGKTFFRKLSSLLLTLIMVFSLTAGVSSVGAAAKAKVSKVSVTNANKKVLYVAKGKKVSVKTDVSVKPNKKANKKVTYKVKSKKVATVTAKGVIKGKKVGSTKLTVTSKIDTKKKTTVTVKVTTPVKKVTLNKTAATIYTGDKLTLSASVTPSKNTYKGVNWKTSNAAVATVENGVVTAKKAGTVTVTATAADGTGKKATCKITVQNKISVNSISILNPNSRTSSTTISVNLSEAKTLTKDSFTVKSKSYQNGTYKTKLEVDSIYTKDNKSYIVYLEDRMYSGNYYSVTVSGLNGIATRETFFKPAGKSYTAQYVSTVGSYYYDYDHDEGFYLDFENMLGGYEVKVVSGKLPAGLKLEDNLILGKPTAFANNQKVVFAATDEFGTVSKITVNFVIGDATHIYAQNRTYGVEIDDEVYANTYNEFYIKAKGGSGYYKIELLDTYGGKFYLDTEEGETFYGSSAYVYTSSSSLTAGNYTLRVKFTDEENSSLSAIGTITIAVTNAYKVTASIKDLTYSELCYYNIYTDNEYYTYIDSKDNTATKYIPAGIYRVYTFATFGERVVLDNFVEISGDTKITFAKPEWYTISGKITETNGKNISTAEVRLRDKEYNSTYDFIDDGTDYKFGNILSGTYTLEVYINLGWGNGMKKVYSTTLTVGKSNVVSNITITIPDVSDTPETIASITEPDTVSLTTTSGISYIKFTPSASDDYVIYAESNCDSYGYLFDADGNQLEYDDDSDDDSDFFMSYYLEEGETYYIGVKEYDDSGYSIDVIIDTEDNYYGY